MRPGEVRPGPGPIRLNEGRPRVEIEVRNTSEWPLGVGSHYHFFEVTRALRFARVAAYGMRLDAPAGLITWFPPGEVRLVGLIPLAGGREVWGFNGLVQGPLAERRRAALEAAAGRGFGRSAGGTGAD